MRSCEVAGAALAAESQPERNAVNRLLIQRFAEAKHAQAQHDKPKRRHGRQ